MKKKYIKHLVVFAMSMLIITSVFSFGLIAHAQDANGLLWGNLHGDVRTRTGLGNQDPRNIAANIINVILGFLGILAVVIILLGGFKWMTAAGNDDKVAEARKLIVAGVIGLVVILAAYAVAAFVLQQLYNATEATG